MAKVGFFGGSFNPLTYAHINLAKQIVNECNLDKLVFVPVGNLYEKQGLIDFKHRYNMINIICNKNDKLEVSNIEENEERKLYAIDVFEIIKNNYPNDNIYYIMGSDNLAKISSWKSYNNLISNYKYIILERKKGAFKSIVNANKDILEHIENFIIVSNYDYADISSSLVREKISKGENVCGLIPKEIEEYIHKNKLYAF